MDLPGASLVPWTSSFLTSPFFPSSNPSSLMPSIPPLQPSSLPSNLDCIPLLQPKSSTESGSAPKSLSEKMLASHRNSTSSQIHPLVHSDIAMKLRFNSPIQPTKNALPHPLPYHSDLAPSPSPLRPHCLAKDCLHLWIPAPNPVASPSVLASDKQLNCILQVSLSSIRSGDWQSLKSKLQRCKQYAEMSPLRLVHFVWRTPHASCSLVMCAKTTHFIFFAILSNLQWLLFSLWPLYDFTCTQ